MKDEGISFDIDESDDVRLPPEPRVEAAHAILEPCVNARGQIILAASSVENICADPQSLSLSLPKMRGSSRPLSPESSSHAFSPQDP
ncbi:hypothetical protein [Mesorhizobium sp.]|uniref:hypothetical protein n=1 Tax=Mesorhizobium sp. TaxID=1871066 RepID=UPI000FE2C846|nr:hypothetical protein [Mesorhizobium sp.]RWN50875.1 MAG: hypothetical protein EOR98_29200 [Mesorhizobium sp.]RWN71985.1 MAG: hypothetical protein EOS02_28955 [Mesorhizobium sp.]RWN72105.1 MAG: hypothetical protein EOS01_29200 [Mesorhizobium sp.]RWN83798.1 MAG: hypothetical protein EOS04_28420 [Mesorhizobium sp.]RWO07884.1 MAG: hypothetical protein EOS15_30130 [Mesorhizobium sp.]